MCFSCPHNEHWLLWNSIKSNKLHIAVVDCRIDLKSDLCVNTNLIYEEWKLVYVCNIMSYKKYLKQNSIIEQNNYTHWFKNLFCHRCWNWGIKLCWNFILKPENAIISAHDYSFRNALNPWFFRVPSSFCWLKFAETRRSKQEQDFHLPNLLILFYWL